MDFIANEQEFLVLNKPGGLLTQAPPGIDSLESRIRNWKAEQDPTRPPYVGIPHRLDRPVSGAMVVGQTKKWTGRLVQQFEQRRVRKCYWAVVEGELADDRGTWVDWMRKCDDRAMSEMVEPEREGAQEAILHYEVRGRGMGRTWLQIQLETGRTHQIRLQSSHHGHPILGDSLYGATAGFGPQCEDLRSRWIALHARELAFDHPRSQERVTFVAALSEHWMGFSEAFPELMA